MLLVVVLLAVMTYGLVRAIERRRAVGGRRPRGKDKPRYVAPDDDEDFLRSLDERDPDPDDPDAPPRT